jgi:hypothetical protein
MTSETLTATALWYRTVREATVAARARIGPGLLLTGVCAVTLSWISRDSFDASPALVVMGGLAFAVGLVVTATAAGEAVTRLSGALLCVAGLAVVVTHHRVWWWLPANWTAPVTSAAMVVAAGGLATLLFAYGFRRAALSGAAGVFAAVCLALTPLPYIGSADQSVLRTLATCFGAVALMAAVTALPPASRRRGRVLAAAAAAVVAVLLAGYDTSRVETTSGHRNAVLLAMLTAITAVTWFAASAKYRTAVPSESEEPDRPATVGKQDRPPRRQSSRAGAVTAPMAAFIPSRGQLESLSLFIGLIVGIVTIVKEAVAMVRAILG